MTSDWDRGVPSMSLSSGKTEAEKLRAAVAYLVHKLGGEVYIPEHVNRAFSTDNPLFQVSMTYGENGEKGYKAWETPGLTLEKRVAQAVYYLRQLDEQVGETTGWQLDRVLWLLTNGVEGRPCHDEMKGAETREEG